MCPPLADAFTRQYQVNMKAFRHEGDFKRDVAETVNSETFADAFKAVRKFWTENAGCQITIQLQISPLATDHLLAGRG